MILPIIPSVLALLEDEDNDVRAGTVSALGQLAQYGGLSSLMGSKYINANIIDEFRQAITSVLSAFVKLFSDWSQTTRVAVAFALPLFPEDGKADRKLMLKAQYSFQSSSIKIHYQHSSSFSKTVIRMFEQQLVLHSPNLLNKVNTSQDASTIIKPMVKINFER